MKTTKPTQEYFGPLVRSFREKVHYLIALGYREAVHRAKQNDVKDETALTGFICEAIETIFRRLDAPCWCMYYSIHDDPPTEDNKQHGRKRPRPDIIVEGHFSGRPQYVFEAKRLSRNGHEVGKYIGTDGLGCFVSGTYARRYDEVGMLGYVQSDTLVYWKDKIRSNLEKRADESCILLQSPQQDVCVIDELPTEWISKHRRPNVGRPIVIYHILLNFRKPRINLSE